MFINSKVLKEEVHPHVGDLLLDGDVPKTGQDQCTQSLMVAAVNSTSPLTVHMLGGRGPAQYDSV